MQKELIPYEFHVTVAAEATDTEKFKIAVSELGAKAIVLDLGVNNGTTLIDQMTSSKGMFEKDEEALDELNRIGDGLAGEGFQVIRRKIETAPWHPSAPQEIGDPMPDGSYFESHMAVRIAPEEVVELRNAIESYSDSLPLHLSRNAFKPIGEDGKLIMMTTLRKYDVDSNTFKNLVSEAQVFIEKQELELEKSPIVEFALYDSNVHQDDKWMEK